MKTGYEIGKLLGIYQLVYMSIVHTIYFEVDNESRFDCDDHN